jgi:RNA polymerase sigma factor (sigma-70 family)
MEQAINFSMTEQRTISITKAIQQSGKKLFAFVRAKVKTNEDAEDILQDVWFQLSKLGDLNELENISAWLYQVARNKVLDRYRKKGTESIEDLAYENEDGEINFRKILFIDDSHNPELALFKEMFWTELMEALDELPKNQREVFVLNEIEDFTLQEIADRKGENLKTIISRKGYAVKHLRRKLNYFYQELNS